LRRVVVFGNKSFRTKEGEGSSQEGNVPRGIPYRVGWRQKESYHFLAGKRIDFSWRGIRIEPRTQSREEREKPLGPQEFDSPTFTRRIVN